MYSLYVSDCVWVHEYVRACYFSIFFQIMVTIISLLLNHSPLPPHSSSSPSPNAHIQHQHHSQIRHRSPTLILTLYLPPSLTHTSPSPSLLSSSSSPHPDTPLLYFAHGDIFRVWRVAVDACFHVHVVMHIAMLKWCIRCYISCGLT